MKLEETYNRWLALMPLSNDDKAKLNMRFTVEYNYNSNHMEGNTLTYGQTELLLAAMLSDKYGKGFDQSSLYKYVRFYTLFPEILDALSPQSPKVDAASQQLLPWTHYRELIRVDDTDARKWYEAEALREMWSTRTLHRNEQIFQAKYLTYLPSKEQLTREIQKQKEIYRLQQET